MDSHPLFEQILTYERCGSTITEARNRLSSLNGNALFIAKEQRSGTGRKGNSWHSPKGGLWFTMVIKSLDVPSGFTLFVGHCLHLTLRELTGSEEMWIKWPNDIYYQEKKVAGIIVKKVLDYHLIGIGINTNCHLPKELEKTATSLQDFGKINNQKVLSHFLDNFQSKLIDYLEQGLDTEYLNKFSFLGGRQVTLGTEFSNYQGIVKNISQDGKIIILLDNGLTQPFCSGSILNFSSNKKR